MHKLQFCSKQCVFLGYNTLHKGFKCLNVVEGRVYVSRDVVFDETVYPFSKLNPNAGARLRGEIQLLSSNSTFMPSSASGDELIVDSTANMHVIPMPTNASCLSVNVKKNLGENHAGIQEENVFAVQMKVLARAPDPMLILPRYLCRLKLRIPKLICPYPLLRFRMSRNRWLIATRLLRQTPWGLLCYCPLVARSR
jgi:hypothetical protein